MCLSFFFNIKSVQTDWNDGYRKLNFYFLFFIIQCGIIHRVSCPRGQMDWINLSLTVMVECFMYCIYVVHDNV